MAAVLKSEFVPFLPAVMDSLIADAVKNVDLKVVSAKEAELENAEEEDSAAAGPNDPMKKMTLSIRGLEGPLQIHMNTAVLENKISALTIIKSLAMSLGPQLGDYVDKIATLLVEDLMHCQVSSSVRKIATKTLSIVIGCARD